MVRNQNPSGPKSGSIRCGEVEPKQKKRKRASGGTSTKVFSPTSLPVCSASVIVRAHEKKEGTGLVAQIDSWANSNAVEIAVLKSRLEFAEEKLGLQAEAAMIQVESAKMKEGVQRLEESRKREDALQEIFFKEKNAAMGQTLSVMQEAQAQAFSFALAFKNGSTDVSVAPSKVSPKEAAFRTLLEKADCEEKFQVLWENSIRSASSVLLLENKTIVDLGITPIQVEILKKVAQSSEIS